MIYKLIIVDDEKAIRDGLAKIVGWTAMGFELVAVLSDGKEAIQYIQSNEVDVILTDISMTFVSGLELAKYVYENMPQIKVVLITGYKEFEYAKLAISYNVVHYLLKPTQLDELNDAFNKLKQQLDKEFEERRQLGDFLPLVQEQFFSDLIMGTLRNREEIKRCIKMIGMDIDPEITNCALLNIHLPDYDHKVTDTWKYGKDGYYAAFWNFLHIESSIIHFLPVFNSGENILVIAIAYQDMNIVQLKSELEGYIIQTQETVSELFNILIDISVEDIYDNLFEVAEGHSIFQSFKGGSDTKRLLEQQKILISYLQDGNYDSVINIFQTIIDEFGNRDFELFRDFIYNLFILLENKLKNFGIEMYFEDQTNRHYRHILNLDSYEEIHLWGEAVLRDMFEFVMRNRGKSEIKFVQALKEYMNKNYSSDISLQDAANYVFLSTSHFGRIFKKHFKENFSDYLVKFRMLKAMELLKNPDYKVYEVSEMVGYKTLKYFYKLFKQNTGFTPTEYRVRNAKKVGNIDE